MMKSSVLRAFLAIAALAALTAQAPPGPTQPPAGTVITPPPALHPDWTAVHIRFCQLLTRGRVGLETGGIEIQYVNLSPVPIKEVDFGVIYRGQPAVIPDVGNFSQNAVIDHTFSNVYVGDSYAGPTPEVCRARKVIFTDGTVSTAPPLTAEPMMP